MLTELEKRLVERQLNVISDVEAVQWAVQALVDNVPLASDPCIVELASLPAPNLHACAHALELLRGAVLRNRPAFDLSSAAAEAYARSLFVALCARLVAGEVRPYDLRKVLMPIEELFGFPTWLGEFYDYSDWCEPEHTAADFPHLIEYAARYVAESKKG